jgi:polysaccharide pyruvyl transferase WcaK-like protein
MTASTTTARPQVDTAPLASGIGYLGWSGRGNLGDDALLEVIRAALPEAPITFVPMDVPGLLRHLGQRPTAGRARRHLVLGGGTAVGRANWRAAVRASALSCGATRNLVGVGVEDPSFNGVHSFSGHGELARWSSTLREFSRVTVRGPRSAELLADVGVDAQVVGDPALLLAPETALAGPRAGSTIAVSLGYGDDLWGHDHEQVIAVVVGVLSQLVKEGWGVRLIVMNKSDLRHATRVQTALDGYDVVVRSPTTAAEYFEATADCSVMLAERLHAGVLASCADLPAVMLEYQPKCRDFMRSIGADDLCVRTDALSVSGLLGLVHRAASDEALRVSVAAAVAQMRGLLSAQVEAMRATILGPAGQAR